MSNTLKALRASPATTKAKAKFILATDGRPLKAEELITGETTICDTERLEKLYGLYTKMTADSVKAAQRKPRGKMA